MKRIAVPENIVFEVGWKVHLDKDTYTIEEIGFDTEINLMFLKFQSRDYFYKEEDYLDLLWCFGYTTEGRPIRLEKVNAN